MKKKEIIIIGILLAVIVAQIGIIYVVTREETTTPTNQCLADEHWNPNTNLCEEDAKPGCLDYTEYKIDYYTYNSTYVDELNALFVTNNSSLSLSIDVQRIDPSWWTPYSIDGCQGCIHGEYLDVGIRTNYESINNGTEKKPYIFRVFVRNETDTMFWWVQYGTKWNETTIESWGRIGLFRPGDKYTITIDMEFIPAIPDKKVVGTISFYSPCIEKSYVTTLFTS
jgi:hypothetical protein